MSGMNGSEHERVAELLSLLRPAPECAVRAAQEMPLLAATGDQVIERAQADDAFRRSLILGLEAPACARLCGCGGPRTPPRHTSSTASPPAACASASPTCRRRREETRRLHRP